MLAALDAIALPGGQVVAPMDAPSLASIRQTHDPLLERVTRSLRAWGYVIRTEQTYLHWILRYLASLGQREATDAGANEVATFAQRSEQPFGLALTPRAWAPNLPHPPSAILRIGGFARVFGADRAPVRSSARRRVRQSERNLRRRPAALRSAPGLAGCLAAAKNRPAMISRIAETDGQVARKRAPTRLVTAIKLRIFRSP
ncbi:hypothetical protein Thivi_0422 [Thiocystis violascens DSM 198]|uniref:Integrase SAM-like N-terminal domain-containing protein n=1 Tax=Thiocystis violascens (strain ATCC 17096 / DSM 198 / 6111) TaxID=765911 RepID=I3Y673_THIV6|nr:hypothetical protein Thivi_0422 [Thiocystis violascens DSM 198]